jgi:hypothetical protein
MRSTWAIARPARVLGRHRHREIVEGERLALHADVAGWVGRGAADQAHVDREGAVEEPLLAVDLEQRTSSSVVAALILPPDRRGSTKVRRPTREIVPGFPAATSR